MDVTRNFLFPQSPAGVEDSNLVELARTYTDTLERVLTATQDALRAVRSNPRLTPLGQQAEASEAVKRAAQKLMGEWERAERLKTAIDRKEGELLSPNARRTLPNGINPDDARAVERETRERLYALKPRGALSTEEAAAGAVSREDVLEKAARDGDTITLRAFDLAPPAFPLVSPESMQEAGIAYAKRVDPTGYHTLEQQRSTLGLMEFAHNTATRELGKMASGAPLSDSVAEMAGAGADE